MKKKEITRRDYDKGVRQAMIDAQNVSDDPMKQFLWLKNSSELSSKQQIMCMVDLVQENYNSYSNQEIKLYDGHIDLLMRAMGDALNHMQEELPSGVYSYIKNNAENTLEDLMRQRSQQEKQNE